MRGELRGCPEAARKLDPNGPAVYIAPCRVRDHTISAPLFGDEIAGFSKLRTGIAEDPNAGEMPPPTRIYLDYNATAPMKPSVRAAVCDALDLLGNPSSVHAFGRAARRAVEDARERVAALVGAAPAQIVFTGSGTEANNLAIRGSGRPRILVSAVEHDSVFASAAEAEVIPVSTDGIVNLAAFAAMLARDSRPALVSVMLANNETGVIQPTQEVIALAHGAGALVHGDAVQAAGRLPIDFAGLGLDYLSLSAHKLGGPPGTGALVCADGAPLAAVILGGGQERRRRAGTENVPGIVGFGRAAEEAQGDIADQPRLAGLRERLERELRLIRPDLTIYGESAARLANTSCFATPGVRSEMQVMALDLKGIAVSAGAACSSGKVGPSRALLALGGAGGDPGCAIRVSLGWDSTQADVDGFVQAWAGLYGRSPAALRATG